MKKLKWKPKKSVNKSAGKKSNVLRDWKNACLDETYEHYTCYLPGNIGRLLSFAFKCFFSGIRADKAQTDIIRNLPKDSIVIYAIKHKSSFEHLFYFNQYNNQGLPYPEINFDHNIRIWQPLARFLKLLLSRTIYFSHRFAWPDPYKSGYIRKKLFNNHAAMLCLVQKKGVYRRFVKEKTDPIRHLIEIQKSTDRPVYIVPQLMFFGKNPMRSSPTITDILFGSETKPGKIRKIVTLFKNPGKVFVEVSEPVNLRAFLEERRQENYSIEDLARILRQNLMIQINRHRQSITGPMLKSREELKESILTNERLRRVIADYSEKEDIPVYKALKKANTYVDEIAAKYSPGFIKFWAIIVSWIINAIFEGITVDNEEINKIKNISRKGPLVLIPCHRSHIDYLILSYMLHINDIPCPHIAAGKNLSFWPLGPMFRAGGAFFIRRAFKGDLLYSSVFSEYIFKLVEEEFNIEFFIEGGRSRTGKMILPKLGLLSTLIKAYKNRICEDMTFVPVYIGYDRVLEEDSYLNELEGGQKKPESLLEMIKARKFLTKKRYGKIYIKFHDPISLKKLLSQMDIEIRELSDADQAALYRNLGHRIINSINNVTVVTPHAVVACAILNSDKKRFSQDHLMNHIETYITHLLFHRAPLTDTLMMDTKSAAETVIDSYVQRKFIDRITLGKEDNDTSGAVFTVNENKRPNLEYYKNNCIAFFIPAAFTSLAILERDAFQFSSTELYPAYKSLRELFKDEFAYDVDNPPEFFVRKNIKAFIDDAVLIPHPKLPDTYNLTSAGFRKLKLFSIFLKPYFESYLIVLNYLMHCPQKPLSIKEKVKKIGAIGNRMYKKEEIDLKEALSDVNYKSAVKFFRSRGIQDSGQSEKIDPYIDSIANYLNYL